MWVWWLILYAVFIALNAAGAEVSFKFAIVVAVLSIGVLVLFGLLAIVNGAVDFGQYNNIEPEAGNSSFLPFGWTGVLYALPFAIWFFLGIEELPLAAEEAHDPEVDIPRAGIIGMLTLVGCGALVLFLNPADTGSAAIAESGEPLLDGFRAFLPAGWAAVLAGFALLGLLASLQGIMFAYARNMYSLSRAGYYPKVLSLTGSRQTPGVSLVVGALIGLVALVLVDYVIEGAGAVVLNIAVWGAVIAYVLQMVSYVLLRRKYPTAVRPYVSPVGIPGAVVAGVIAAITFVGVLVNETYRPAIVAIVVLYAVGLALFAVFGRHRLILSPEEEYAMSGGLHRDPEVEHYGSSLEAELPPEDFTEED
jgi:ethanolamine permease